MQHLRAKWIRQMKKAHNEGNLERVEALYEVIADTEQFTEQFNVLQAELTTCFRDADNAYMEALHARNMEEVKEQADKRSFAAWMLEKMNQLEQVKEVKS